MTSEYQGAIQEPHGPDLSHSCLARFPRPLVYSLNSVLKTHTHTLFIGATLGPTLIGLSLKLICFHLNLSVVRNGHDHGRLEQKIRLSVVSLKLPLQVQTKYEADSEHAPAVAKKRSFLNSSNWCNPV